VKDGETRHMVVTPHLLVQHVGPAVQRGGHLRVVLPQHATPDRQHLVVQPQGLVI
jgi:hypothetical protein